MNRSEVIAGAISAINSEAIPSSDDERAQKATKELEAGEITEETIAFMDESIEHWWQTFGGGLGPEESSGEILIGNLEKARDDLKCLL